MTRAELKRAEELAASMVSTPGASGAVLELAAVLERTSVYARDLQATAMAVSRAFEDYTGRGNGLIVDLDNALAGRTR